MKPIVSIILPNLNRAPLLRAALESVRAQTSGDWEAIVVDDGSTDDSVAMAGAMASEDSRIRVLRRSGDVAGAQPCRNQGAAAARGEFLIFLDSDDALAPHCLEQRVRVMRDEPDLDFAVFPCRVFKETPGDTPWFWNAHTPEPDLDRLLKLDVPWQTAGPIWRREAVERVGPWDERLLSWQDWDYHLRAIAAGLRYRKFEVADCYWRMPTKQWKASSDVAGQPRHVAAQELLLTKTTRALQDAGLLTDERRRWMAGLYMLLVRQWLRGAYRPGRALDLWRAGRANSTIDWPTYAWGCLYIALHPTRLGRELERRLGPGWAGVTPAPPFVPHVRQITSVRGESDVGHVNPGLKTL